MPLVQRMRESNRTHGCFYFVCIRFARRIRGKHASPATNDGHALDAWFSSVLPVSGRVVTVVGDGERRGDSEDGGKHCEDGASATTDALDA